MSSPSRFPFPAYPTGWYVVAFAGELAAGEVQSRTIFGREVVLFRGTGGRAALLDAHCPHMGGHLGHGGRVVGDSIRCAFHGFCFDGDGACVAGPETTYDSRLPPKARATTWTVQEVNGVVLAWFDAAGRQPLWQIPELPSTGWTRIAWKRWPKLRSHPQETTENSVDVGHFSVVHGYTDVSILEPLQTDGAYLTTKYRMRRVSPFSRRTVVQADFEIHVHGLGWSHVEVQAEPYGLRTRQYVLPLPVDEEHVELRIGMAIQEPGTLSSVSRFLQLMPKSMALELMLRVAQREYERDVSQDFRIWENKSYLHPPALAPGDGPVGRYRAWAQRFYPGRDDAALAG